MPRQITPGSTFWARLRGDALSGNGSGDDDSNPLAFEQFNRDIGQTGDAAATTDTGSFSLIALAKRALSRYKQTRLSTAVLTAITTNLTTSQQLYPASAGRKIIANQTTTRAFVLLGSGTASATNYSYIVYPGAAVEDDFEGAAQVICEAGATGQINRTVLT